MSHINVYYDNLLAWGSRLLGWFYEKQPMNRGYLTDTDFPGLVDGSQRQVLKSRSYIFYAFYKKIQGDGQFHAS